MKALSLHEPWASAVRDSVKKIETRTWGTSYRGELAIHAAKKRVDWFTVPDAAMRLYKPAEFSYGCFIAIVTLSDCFEMTDSWIWRTDPKEREWGNYEPGRWAWILTQVGPLCPPVPGRGWHHLWNVELFGR